MQSTLVQCAVYVHSPIPDTSIPLFESSGGQHMDDRLIAELEPSLRQIATARLRGESNCSLSAGDLLNEAILRIISLENIEFNGRAHALAWASKIMRQVLIDHARRKNAEKRAHQPVTLVSGIPGDDPIELLELDDILNSLADIDEERARLVEMRFFGGMTIPEIAEASGYSEATVKRRWVATRAWLQDRMERP